eukprot:TRINITY_DN1722_c1_g1_i5.p1 TRINITY_DN1722_c1_g1~~TRINITY_DN1722_c1_g1_i5.p1  ORF type:complete len:318 (+),score=89.65 TRINITY_DN1722_c1_g1_i5:85-1038(+)
MDAVGPDRQRKREAGGSKKHEHHQHQHRHHRTRTEPAPDIAQKKQQQQQQQQTGGEEEEEEEGLSLFLARKAQPIAKTITAPILINSDPEDADAAAAQDEEQGADLLQLLCLEQNPKRRRAEPPPEKQPKQKKSKHNEERDADAQGDCGAPAAATADVIVIDDSSDVDDANRSTDDSALGPPVVSPSTIGKQCPTVQKVLDSLKRNRELISVAHSPALSDDGTAGGSGAADNDGEEARKDIRISVRVPPDNVELQFKLFKTDPMSKLITALASMHEVPPGAHIAEGHGHTDQTYRHAHLASAISGTHHTLAELETFC